MYTSVSSFPRSYRLWDFRGRTPPRNHLTLANLRCTPSSSHEPENYRELTKRDESLSPKDRRRGNAILGQRVSAIAASPCTVVCVCTTGPCTVMCVCTTSPCTVVCICTTGPCSVVCVCTTGPCTVVCICMYNWSMYSSVCLYNWAMYSSVCLYNWSMYSSVYLYVQLVHVQ